MHITNSNRDIHTYTRQRAWGHGLFSCRRRDRLATSGERPGAKLPFSANEEDMGSLAIPVLRIGNNKEKFISDDPIAL